MDEALAACFPGLKGRFLVHDLGTGVLLFRDALLVVVRLCLHTSVGIPDFPGKTPAVISFYVSKNLFMRIEKLV